MIGRLTDTMVGAVVWAISSQHRRNRQAQIDFYATRMWSGSTDATESETSERHG